MSIGDSFSNTVMNGSLVLALIVAVIAGLVRSYRPCVLPWCPGYLSYVTGLTGVDLASAKRGRIARPMLFVLVFTVASFRTASLRELGTLLLREQAWITRVLVVVTIVMAWCSWGTSPDAA